VDSSATNISDSRRDDTARRFERDRNSVVATIDRWVESIPSRARMGLIIIGILFVGNLDYSTGGEISFSIFYLVPISAAARFHTRSAAARVAIFAGLIWLLVELLTHAEFSHALIPLWNAAGRTLFFLLLVGYITEVYRRDAWLEAEVHRHTVALREMISSRKTLEREMAQAVAREHSQIARELHDGVGQYLAGLALRARGLADGLKQDGSSHAARAEEFVEKLATTNRMLRRLDHILSPAIATEGGLAVALGRLVADVRQFSGLECKLDLPKESFVIGEFQALTLFRIAQEAISNSVKHSGTGTVRVELAVDDVGVRLTVADDGPGLSLRSTKETGEGLRIMRHRAELIGARLDIRSDGGSGWRVECVLPWRGASPVLPRET
jgi:signal transduction histidine kinase